MAMVDMVEAVGEISLMICGVEIVLP